MHIKPSILLLFLLFASVSTEAAHADNAAGAPHNCRSNNGKRDCDSGPAWCKTQDGTCRSDMHGRCGKRKGDWYGASRPVATATEARALLLNFFSGQLYSVADITEKKWGFKADILDKDGKTVDRVMIDKRTGRIRSLY